MKQLSKRVSAALLAVLMGLSLLPQTVLALDPDQRQAERREGYLLVGAGGHDTGTYTVANCYYLLGCDNDPDSNGWYRGTSTTCTIDVTGMTQAQMQSRELTDRLNQNGGAFVYREGQYPILFWEQESYHAGNRQVTVQSTDTATASQATLKLTAESATAHKVWTMAADTGWYNETDTEFTLTTARQLAGLAKLVKENVTFEGKTIRLGADIYLLWYEETGKPWWDGIGITTSSTAVFKGTFDGCGHTIDQMLAGSGGSGAALFLNTDGAAIQNLTVIGSAEASCCAAPTMAGSMPNSPGTPAALWAC